MANLNKHVEKVCNVTGGLRCCRYLSWNKNGYTCMKNTDAAAFIDTKVKAGTFQAQGDNCPGKSDEFLNRIPKSKSGGKR